MLQKLVSSSLGNGQTLVNVGASVAITDGPNTNTVLISGEAETLKLFNETQGASDIPLFLRDFEAIPFPIILISHATSELDVPVILRAFN